MQRITGIAALPLFWISLSFTIGVTVGSIWLPAVWLCWAACGLGVVNALGIGFLKCLPEKFSQNQKTYILIGLAISAFALGMLRCRAAQPDFSPSDLAYYNGLGRISVTGVIAQDPDVRDTYTQVRVEVDQLTLSAGGNSYPVEGLLLAYLPKSGWRYGDRLYLSGELSTPPQAEDFSYREYLARWEIHSYMPFAYADRLESGQGVPLKAWIYSFKQSALGMLYRFLPDPEASLAAGILLGVESGIPKKVKLAFQDTGTTHIIAISGFNITIVAGMFAILFERLLGPRRGAVVSIVGISMYTLLVGADPPVVRAAIMGGLSLFARQVGRRQHGLNSLSFTAAVMLAFNPLLLSDAGFQLSFAAALGLIVYAEPWTAAIENWIGRLYRTDKARSIAAPISEYFLLTIAAQLTTLPILLYHFQRFSWVSLPANLLILPAQPPIMILGGISVLIGFLFPLLGQLCAYLVWPFVAYTIHAVEWVAGFQQVKVIGQVSIFFVISYYLVLLIATLFDFHKFKEFLPKINPVFALIGLLVVVVLVWQAALAAPDGYLHVTILDVGDGAGVLIQTPEGRYVLIGGGSSTIRLSDSLGRFLPLFHRNLDLLIVPSTEKSYVSALPVVAARFPPGQVYWSGGVDTSREAEELYTQLSARHHEMVPISAGDRIQLGGGAQLEVIVNRDHATVVRLEWGNFQMVLPFMGDDEEIDLNQLSRKSGGVSVVLLSGSVRDQSSWEQWFTAFNPALIVVSRQSAGGMLTRQLSEEWPILSTDRTGWVCLITDGNSLWVQVEEK